MPLRLLLINPFNPLVSITKTDGGGNRWNAYRRWKPLGLAVLAGLTPSEWEVSILDENVAIPDYDAIERPDLVGITAFTSQASRAYEVADALRAKKIPVVMGGIHVSMCIEEATQHADAVVTGEAEGVWAQLLEDVQRQRLKKVYRGTWGELEKQPLPRHDLLTKGYKFGSIQTTRGCPLACTFCSVTAFNGARFRHRPIDDVIAEFKLIKEKFVLVVDDNLIGTRKDHIAKAKDLFRAMIKNKIKKAWIAQVTINLADDPELLQLAYKAGCKGVFVGFEATTPEGLIEVHKKFNIRKGRDLPASVKRIQKAGLMVLGAFVIGLDSDKVGAGANVAATATVYGIDAMNVLFLTPLPGTALWRKMEAEDRIIANDFPEDWKYYTLNHPVAAYKNLSWPEMVQEMAASYKGFYSWAGIFKRALNSLWRTKSIVSAIVIFVTNMTYRLNLENDLEVYSQMDLTRGKRHQVENKQPQAADLKKLPLAS